MNTCKSCGYKGLFPDGKPGCYRTKLPVDEDKDYCSYHKLSSMETCDLCGSPIVEPSDLIYVSDINKALCKNCYANMYTCQLCENAKDCAFQRNEFNLPPVVMKTVRQGNMTMQTQQRNPELIEKTCKAGCPCWGEDSCMRESDGTCANHKFILT